MGGTKPKSSSLSPNFTPGIMQSDKYVRLATVKPTLVYQMARWRSVIRHCREHMSTSLESIGDHCSGLGDVRFGAAGPWTPSEALRS